MSPSRVASTASCAEPCSGDEPDLIAGDAEIEHLHEAGVGDHHVGRLQIAVNDAFFVRDVERLRDLASDCERVGQRQRAPSQSVAQRVAGDELEHERAQTVGLLDAVNRRDVRVVQRRENPRFPLEAGQAIRVAARARAGGS